MFRQFRSPFARLVFTAVLWIGSSVSLPPAREVNASDLKEVRLLTLHGIINPVTLRYISRELDDAARAQAGAVVLSIDSPGGLESPMREIVQQILNSPVPVITYVSPSGARAASAGMFITIAGHVAAMAPGTNIGAAHPVAMTAQGEKSSVIEEKILNDAAALSRSIATERKRNGEWPEQAVRKSVSITAEEAQKMRVIDLTAPTLGALLHAVDGRIVQTASGASTLKTTNARVVDRPMTLPERILQALTDPNIAYILLTIGFMGIIAEFYHPGMILPGAIGVLSLLLGYVALGSLPINWVGLFLILAGIVLLIVEIHNPTLGAFGSIGLAAFILGSLMLYRPLTPTSPAMPLVHVSLWVLIPVTMLIAGFFLIVLRAAWSARRRPISAGPEALIGRNGIAESDLNPRGFVNLKGERWTAEVDYPDGPQAAQHGLRLIRAGESVEVSDIQGVTLKVRRSKG